MWKLPKRVLKWQQDITVTNNLIIANCTNTYMYIKYVLWTSRLNFKAQGEVGKGRCHSLGVPFKVVRTGKVGTESNQAVCSFEVSCGSGFRCYSLWWSISNIVAQVYTFKPGFYTIVSNVRIVSWVFWPCHRIFSHAIGTQEWDGRFASDLKIVRNNCKSVSIWLSRSLDKTFCDRDDTYIRDEFMETRLNRPHGLTKNYEAETILKSETIIIWKLDFSGSICLQECSVLICCGWSI